MKKALVAIVIAVVGAFLGYVIIAMASMEVEITLVQDYVVPEFNELLELEHIDEGHWAIAVDGVPIAGRQNDELRPTASTAKMILALAVMEKRPFSLGESGENIVITNEMYNRYIWYTANYGSVTAVRIGENISQYDALVSVLVASSNNMADALAVWAFGSIEEYAKYAGEMLVRLGLNKTRIGIDASGYSETTVSTANELAQIGYLVLKNPVLAEIVAKKTAVVPVAGEIKNTNKLLGEHGIIGVKTGYIGAPSGYCLVSGYPIGEHFVTIASLGALTRESSFRRSEQIAAIAQEELKLKEIVQPEQTVGYYEGWWLGRIPIKATNAIEALGWAGVESKTDLSTEKLSIIIANQQYETRVETVDFPKEPTLWQRFLHVFGWTEADNN